MKLNELPTPALVVDLDRLERNIERMADRARQLGVRLRPHVKTHKCLEIGRMQLAAGASGITVSTIEEARAFADGGFDDITRCVPRRSSLLRCCRRLDRGGGGAEGSRLRIQDLDQGGLRLSPRRGCSGRR